jgi:predicted nucleotidyltransferase
VNEPLEITLADAVRFLEERRLPYALIGGLAASIHGQPRVTADVDLVVVIDLDAGIHLADSLDGTSFRPLFPNASEVVEKSYILPMRHRVTNLKVDLAIGLSGFEQQAVARARSITLAGVDVQVASPEDILLMKVMAGRPQDDQDVAGIIATRGERLDWDYCLETATELGEAIGQDLAARVRRLKKDPEEE